MNRFFIALALSFAAPVAVAQCTISSPGSLITPTPFDGWTAIQPIGFAFPFAGTTYSGLYITDHGVIALSNAGVPAVPLGGSFVWNPFTASLVAGGPLITAYWSDHTPGTGGTIHIDNTSGSHCTITWQDMQTYSNQTPAFTTQVTLYPDGHVGMCLDNRVNNSGSTFGALNAIMGMSPGTPSVLPAASDISTSPVTLNNTIFEEWVTTAASTPNPLFDVANTTITFIPLNPGWAVIVDPLACANKATYGVGCDGMALNSNLPVLGTNWVLTTTGISPISPISITFFGTSRVDPGLPLPAIGIPAPGCTSAIIGLLANLSAPSIAGVSTLSIPMPLNASLKGASLTAQSLGLTLNNPSNLATSNGLEGTLGY